MSNYVGDIRLSDTIHVKFTTRQISGAPATLASSPVISAYPSNSTTQLTAGITLTVDFDSVTGYNNIAVVASGANGYVTATDYDLAITTGTVNSVSVVGESVGAFSIEHRSALMPTTAARTADVSAGGEVGVDWANVGSPTTAVDLSGTNIKTDQKVDLNTIKTQAVTAGAGVTILASVGTAATSTAQTGDNYARIGAPAGASVSADIAAVKAETASIKAKTDNLPSDPADASDIATATNAIYARIGAPVGASISADIAAVQADTDNLQTRIPAALTGGGNLKVDVLAVNSSTNAAANLSRGTLGTVLGTCGSGSTTTNIVTSALDPAGASTSTDQLKGRIVTFDRATTTAALRGQATDITGSSMTGELTVTALTSAPANGDTFTIT